MGLIGGKQNPKQLHGVETGIVQLMATTIIQHRAWCYLLAYETARLTQTACTRLRESVQRTLGRWLRKRA